MTDLVNLELGERVNRLSCLKALNRLVSAALLLTAGAAFAQDRAVIDPTVILGNRELPKVLYIVPWKKPVPGDLTGRPLVSVVDEALAPLDRDVFRRQVQYQTQYQAQQQAALQARLQAEAQAQQQAQAQQTPAAQPPPGQDAGAAAKPAPP